MQAWHQPSVVAALAAVGGVGAIVGSALPWAETRIQLLGLELNQSPRGLAVPYGRVTLALGLALLVAAPAPALTGARRARAVASGVVVLTGLAAAAVGAYQAARILTQAVDAITREAARIALATGFGDLVPASPVNAVEVSLGIGLYLVIAGGAAAAAAGGAALSLSRGARLRGVSPPGPEGGSGP